jgi:hypothetical protein
VPRAAGELPSYRRLGLVLVLAATALQAPARAAEDGSTSPPSGLESLKSALEGIREGLGLSGFFDVRAADSRTDPNVFSMGDFELDLAREIGKSVQVAAALVVNDEGTSLAVGFVDVHLLGGLVAPRGRLPVEKGFHVQLGRFDVPFGNDWRTFAAKDRIELSGPLTTEVVMDGGYNDVGVRAFGNTGSLDYTAYWLRGEGKGTLVGGRLGFMPFDNPYRLRGRVRPVEIGVSALHDFDGDGGTESTSFGVDTELRVPLGRLRAEFLRRDLRPAEGRDERVVRSGFHVTATVDVGAPAGVPLTPYVRYDTAKDEPSSPSGPSADEAGGRTERLSAGANASLLEVLFLKLEYQRTLAAPSPVEAEEAFHRDSFLAQVVVSF